MKKEILLLVLLFLSNNREQFNYQLSPVNSLRKGIYIQNGKKIAVM